MPRSHREDIEVDDMKAKKAIMRIWRVDGLNSKKAIMRVLRVNDMNVEDV